MATSWTHPNQKAIDEIVQCQYDVKNVRSALQFGCNVSDFNNWPPELRFCYATVIHDLISLNAQLQIHRIALWDREKKSLVVEKKREVTSLSTP